MRILSLSSVGPAVIASMALAASSWAKDISYKASVEVEPADARHAARCAKLWAAHESCTLNGRVFHDINRDGLRQTYEPGVAGVLVSNGLEVVRTDWLGRYQLPVQEQEGGTTIFITKPAGYDVPVDEQNIPQFFYHHVPEGSPPLRFGGLAPTGPLPRAINFPLSMTGVKNRFKIVVSGDTQPYSNNEIGYVRDTLARDVAAMGDDVELVMVEGDILGDDLGLFPRYKEVMSLAGSPVYLVPGNHDADFDAPTDAFSFDTFRREWGPAYYSFDIGQVHFVGLDTVRYPCTPELDNLDGRHAFCDEPATRPTYNGVIDEKQMQWLRNDLQYVPRHKLVVLNMHIPLVSFVDQEATKHQVDNTVELYQLLEGRKALALSGHTHTLEQLRPGELFAGWQSSFAEPLGPTPFPQIVTGATAGSWWSGDFTTDGIPNSLQRLGAPRGHLVIEFDGNTYRDTFKATGQSIEKQMSVSILSPTFKGWYDELYGWLRTDAMERSPIPPVSINDLPDPSIVTASDLEGDVYLVANIWNGSRDSLVWAYFDNGSMVDMERVQAGEGEGRLSFLDPYAIERQMYVLRYGITSESGEARAQGFELFRGSRFEGEPQPLSEWLLTDQSNHVWVVRIPQDLEPGAHTVRVLTVDLHGRQYHDLMAFEIMDERPQPYFRAEAFE
jgi:hypothetical protein